MPRESYQQRNWGGTTIFQSPAVSFAYERGWRQAFVAYGFPGLLAASGVLVEVQYRLRLTACCLQAQTESSRWRWTTSSLSGARCRPSISQCNTKLRACSGRLVADAAGHELRERPLLPALREERQVLGRDCCRLQRQHAQADAPVLRRAGRLRPQVCPPVFCTQAELCSLETVQAASTLCGSSADTADRDLSLSFALSCAGSTCCSEQTWAACPSRVSH